MAAGLTVTEQVQNVPKRERDLAALEELYQERNLSQREPPLTAVCSFDEEIYTSVEPCRENKYHPHQLPSKETLPTPRLCQRLSGRRGTRVPAGCDGVGRARRERALCTGPQEGPGGGQ